MFNWISSGNFIVNWSINIDPLSSVMLVVVSLISAIIHFYSIGYMDHDPNKTRFMSYLSLFTFSIRCHHHGGFHKISPGSSMISYLGK